MSHRNTIERFIELADVTNTDECIHWKYSKDSSGYGLFKMNNKLYKTHRLSYQLSCAAADITQSMVMHSCDNPSCINPKHLSAGTNADNMRDMYSKGRGNSIETIAKKLTWEKAREIRAANGTHQEIANKYKIDRTMVGKIKSGVCWQDG